MEVKSKVLSQQLEYWREQLTGIPEVINLPVDHARPKNLMYPARRINFTLPTKVISSLRKLAQQNQASLFMVLLSALQITLHRYSGQKTIVVGSPVADHAQKAAESIIGFCSNALALKADFQKSLTVNELVQQVRETTLGAYANQDVTFDQLMEHLKITRQLNVNPLFQVMLAYKPFQEAVKYSSLTQLDDLNVSSLEEAECPTARFDLALCVMEGLNEQCEFNCYMEYSRDLFKKKTLEKLINHFQTILRHMVKMADKPIYTLPMLSKAELNQQLITWNKTEKPYSQATVHELFEQQVEKTPNNIAVVYEKERLAYRELNQRANQVAHCLRKNGVGGQPDMLVAIGVERSVEMLVGILAILKAGGSYVPLDPNYPDERLQFMIADIQPSMLLTQIYLSERLSQLLPKGTKSINLDDKCFFDGMSTSNLENTARFYNLAYVIYTSGSTGQPKGVMIKHASLLNVILSFKRLFPSEPMSTWLSEATLSFDISGLELWVPLLSGAKTIIARDHAEMFDVSYLESLIRKHSIRIVQATPSLWNELLKINPKLLSNVTAISGGETLSPALSQLILEKANSLYNVYGPTETAIWSTLHKVHKGKHKRSIPIGAGVLNTFLYVLDTNLQLLPTGVVGELYIGGAGLARGYLNRPELTAEKFISNPFATESNKKNGYDRLYKTGDLVRYLPDGNLDFMGRADHQVKIRGFRIELGEIEFQLLEKKGVSQAIILAREDVPGNKQLVAYVVGNQAMVNHSQDDGGNSTDLLCQSSPLSSQELKKQLQAIFPGHMVPAHIIVLDALPLMANGKVDRKSLPAPGDVAVAGLDYIAPQTEIEHALISIWSELLNLPTESIGIHDNFFDLGGQSLLMAELKNKVVEKINCDVSLVDLYHYPKISALAQFFYSSLNLGSDSIPPQQAMIQPRICTHNNEAIAVVGLSGRFSGFSDVQSYWQGLQAGDEAIRFYTDEELQAAGVPKATYNQNTYVNAKGEMQGYEYFDSVFFGVSPREAQLMDPQQRIFLEESVKALEDAGINYGDYQGRIGVFAGSGPSDYQLRITQAELIASHSQGGLMLGSDFLASRVAYKLNLTGPAVTVQTACSTSLVAIHQACQNLRNGESDVILAGGVSLGVIDRAGYEYQVGGIASPDGHCRAFDAKSKGMVGGQGVGIVVLKRLSDALRENDRIYAVVKGSSMNNDGSNKVSFTAPSVNGQAAVIRQAQANAGVDAKSIDFVETHGTGTELGDPIEIAALCEVFGAESRDEKCALGSVKTNIGHTDSAAGVAGLIKAVLCIYHKTLVPTLHYESPNPLLNLEKSPFFINTDCQYWAVEEGKRLRAGVSSFGIGGTNVHAILEGAPSPLESSPSQKNSQLICLSAKSPESLQRYAQDLKVYFQLNPKVSLADVAYTLQMGRCVHDYRATIVVRTVKEAIQLLDKFRLEKPSSFDRVKKQMHNIVFLFPGQGSQYSGMAAYLYDDFPVFKSAVNECVEIISRQSNMDILPLLLGKDIAGKESLINQTQFAQPAIFVMEYALAQHWKSWGINPASLCGHSIGEYVAGTLAGIFTLADALQLVCVRGKLIQALPEGEMLSVPLSESETVSWIAQIESQTIGREVQLALAVVNSHNRCVVSGAVLAINTLQKALSDSGIASQLLHTSHAFHSHMMTPILTKFKDAVEQCERSAPNKRIISNVTGTWLTPEQAQSSSYWVEHLRQTVRFNQGLETLYKQHSNGLMLEVGPNQVLTQLARSHPGMTDQHFMVPSLSHAKEDINDESVALNRALGKLWEAGVNMEWARYYGDEVRLKLSLPSYSFEKQRHWLDQIDSENIKGNKLKRKPLSQWFYTPGWVRQPASFIRKNSLRNEECLIRNKTIIFFSPRHEWSRKLSHQLLKQGNQVILVYLPIRDDINKDELMGSSEYRLIDYSRSSYDALCIWLSKLNLQPDEILHGWTCQALGQDAQVLANAHVNQAKKQGYLSLLYLAQAVVSQWPFKAVCFTTVTTGIYSFSGEEVINPINATLLGLNKVLPQEHLHFKSQLIDVLPQSPHISSQVMEYLSWCTVESEKCLRGRYAWYEQYELIVSSDVAKNPMDEQKPFLLRDNGVYLITGGLGGIGLTFAKYLAKTLIKPIIVLVSRKQLPNKSNWKKAFEQSKNSATSSIAAELMTIESLGARVVVESVDIANENSVGDMFSRIYGKLKCINGVFHAAGIGTNVAITDENEQTIDAIFAAKIQGTLLLDQYLSWSDLDFMLLCSSMSTVLGGCQMSGYVAANAFLDAYASYHSDRKAVVLSINWDTWQEIGMAVTPNMTEKAKARFLHAIKPKEAEILFSRLLSASGLEQVLVTTRDINEQMKSFKSLFTSDKFQSHLEVVEGSSIEDQLMSLCRQHLGVMPEIDKEDFFIFSGGDSLGAVQFAHAIHQQFNVVIGPPDIRRLSTLDNLIQFISGQLVKSAANEEKPFVLVKLNNVISSVKPPIFMPHAVGGTVYYYFDLANQLDRPVYGLQHQALDGSHDMNLTVETMASMYIEAIKTVQPKGPYQLVGHSFGGTLAYEMTQQLTRLNEYVTYLALLDTPSLGYMPKKETLQDQTAMIPYMLELIGQDVDESFYQLSEDEQLFFCYNRLPNSPLINKETKPDIFVLRNNMRLTEANGEAMMNYKPAVLERPDLVVHFYRALERDSVSPEHPENGWQELLGERVILRQCEGNHGTMIDKDICQQGLVEMLIRDSGC